MTRLHTFAHRFGIFVPVLALVVALMPLSDAGRTVAAQTSGRDKDPARNAPPLAPSAGLDEIERRNIDVFKRVSPSVVSVANRALVRDFWGLQVYEVPQGAGSGFVWDKEGHIVSNFHVVQDSSAIEITMKDGSTHEAKVVGVDPDHDIAVLKIAAPRDKAIPIPQGTSADLQVGQRVLAIGNPFGLDCTLTVGTLSSIGRSMRSVTGVTIHDMLQTDASINSGNSGGPLLDSSGRLIGINAAIVSPSGGSVGLGFAIPADTVRSIVPQLISFGKIKRAGLGIELVPDLFARRYGIEGVIIRKTFPNGPAAKAALRGTTAEKVGDIIVEVDGKKVASSVDVRDILDRKKEGDSVDVVYIRGGEKKKVRVTLQTVD